MYFSHNKNLGHNDPNSNDLKYRVEVFCAFTDISNSHRSMRVKLSIQSDKKYSPAYLGATEFSDGSQEFSYKTSFVTDYYFEKQQDLIVCMELQNSNLTETLKCSMGNIMGSRNNKFKITGNDGSYEVSFEAKKVEIDKTDISLGIKVPEIYNSEIFYIISSKNDDKNWRSIYKSEERLAGNSFDLIEVESTIICRGDLSRKVMVEFYKAETSEIITRSIFNFTEAANNRYIALENGASTEIFIEVVKNLNFVDYLIQGLQINVVIGVDFTLSNKPIDNPESLHYIYGSEPNAYERAIRSCGNILAYYDYDQQFPILGFGGIPEGAVVVEHSFPLNYNFTGSPNVGSVNELVNVYKQALTRTRLYGPTNFSPLIKNTCKIARSAEVGKYFILMILTDGLITDMDETSEAIVEASNLPISIIIIGIGKEDFSNMDILDGDEIPLKSPISGKIVSRDIVQFVEFRKYETDSNKLAEAVLEEVPKQVEDYYRGKKLVFNKIKENQMMVNINNHESNANLMQGNFTNSTNMLNHNFINNNMNGTHTPQY